MAASGNNRYGSWRSPITSEFVVSDVVGLSDIQLNGKETYWAESRPREAGRVVVVKCGIDGVLTDINPAPYNVRTRVHEYGGGAYVVYKDMVFFSNFTDQKLYRMVGGVTAPLTEDGFRYADAVVDPVRNRLICVQEDHTNSAIEAINTIVDVDIEGNRKVLTLIAGNDFYSSPALSPDGSRLAWLTWNHPDMPWVGTELWVADVSSDGSLSSHAMVAGGRSESIFQPSWSPDGTLHFVSDRTGWWNLYRANKSGIEALMPMEAEFGVPQWTFGLSCYAFISERQIVCAFTQEGLWNLGLLDLDKGKIENLNIAGTDFGYVNATNDRIVVKAGSPSQPPVIIQRDLTTGKDQILQKSTKPPSPDLQPYISTPKPYEFKTDGGLISHAFFYRPTNPDYSLPTDELPPLIVKSHGGPTAATSSTLDYKIQYWTSRGFAVLDVNYGGSTGYGRGYRERLKEQWGIVDVSDCVHGANALMSEGAVDGKRLLITGGSAGGYTTLCALTFHKMFSAGASYYGISDLEALARDTHKFESHYMDWLVAPYPSGAHIYKQRSPINFASQVSVPVIFLQGEEDKIVPPNQTELMVDALRSHGLPFGYLLFAGEQHGFRRADNIKRSLDAELYFYALVSLKTGLRF